MKLRDLIAGRVLSSVCIYLLIVTVEIAAIFPYFLGEPCKVNWSPSYLTSSLTRPLSESRGPELRAAAVTHAISCP